MNKEFYIIPKTVVVYAAKKMKNNGSPFCPDKGKFIAGIGKDKLKSTLNKITKDLTSVTGNYSGNTEKDYDIFEITNSKLSFKIPDDPDIIEWVRNYKYYGYHQESFIEIESPELPESNRYYVYVNTNTILEAISKRNVIDGRITGNYCLEILKDTITDVRIHLENPVDEEQKRAKEIGDSLSKPLTSNWEPGGLYAKKDGKFILYLGQIGRNYVTRSYNGSYFSHSTFISTDDVSHYEKPYLDLCILIDSIEQANNYRGRDLSEILSKILCSNTNNLIRIDLKTGTAAKVENLLYVENDFVVENFVKSYCLDSIKNTPIEKLTDLQKFHLLFLPKKIDELKDEILAYRRNLSLKFLLPDLKKKLANEGNDFVWKWLNNNFKKEGKMPITSGYNRGYDFIVGSSQIFSKEDLEKNMNTFIKEIIKELGLTEPAIPYK